MLKLSRFKLYPCLRTLRRQAREAGRQHREAQARQARQAPRQTREALRRLLISRVIGDDDILTEIFLRTPVDSLLQLKSVCKRWNNVISDPYFCVERSKTVGEPTGLFVRAKSEEVPLGDVVYAAFVPFHVTLSQPSQLQLSFEDRPLPRSLRWPDTSVPLVIVDSCNGLACCYTCAVNQENFDAAYIYELVGKIIIFNPTTMRYRDIPWPNFADFQISSVEATNLAFNPRTSPSFKILMVHRLDEKYERYGRNDLRVITVRFDIYCSLRDNWQLALDYEAHDILFDQGVFWDGKIYFPSLRNDGMYVDLEERNVAEVFPMPGPQDIRRFIFYFGENRNRLHVILDRYDRDIGRPCTLPTAFDIYEMVDHLWELKYIVENPQWEETFVLPMCVILEENEAQSFLVLFVGGDIVKYNFRDGTVEPLCQIDDFLSGGLGHIDRSCVLHTPSLAPVVAPGQVVAAPRRVVAALRRVVAAPRIVA